MVENRFLKRLSKKARKGLRGWPIATIAFYGPNLSQATKVAVGIVPSENAEVEELRDWKVDRGDIRADSDISRQVVEFIEQHQARSVAVIDGIIGGVLNRKESITNANGAQSANFGTEEIGLRGRESINLRGSPQRSSPC